MSMKILHQEPPVLGYGQIWVWYGKGFRGDREKVRHRVKRAVRHAVTVYLNTERGGKVVWRGIEVHGKIMCGSVNDMDICMSVGDGSGKGFSFHYHFSVIKPSYGFCLEDRLMQFMDMKLRHAVIRYGVMPIYDKDFVDKAVDVVKRLYDPYDVFIHRVKDTDFDYRDSDQDWATLYEMEWEQHCIEHKFRLGYVPYQPLICYAEGEVYGKAPNTGLASILRFRLISAEP